MHVEEVKSLNLLTVNLFVLLLQMGVNKRYADETQMFLNDSFIPEFTLWNYVIQQEAKDKILFSYKVRIR